MLQQIASLEGFRSILLQVAYVPDPYVPNLNQWTKARPASGKTTSVLRYEQPMHVGNLLNTLYQSGYTMQRSGWETAKVKKQNPVEKYHVKFLFERAESCCEEAEYGSATWLLNNHAFTTEVYLNTNGLASIVMRGPIPLFDENDQPIMVWRNRSKLDKIWNGDKFPTLGLVEDTLLYDDRKAQVSA